MLDSPNRLTALVFAASVLSVAGFVCGGLRSVHSSLPLLIISFATVTVGLLGMYCGAYALGEHVRNERWTEETLAPFRRITDHVFWKAGMALLFLAMLAALFQDRHHRGWFWGVFLLLQTQTQITNAFARVRKPSGGSSRPDWSKFRPLHSDHWGQR